MVQPYPDMQKQPEWTCEVKPDPLDWDAEVAAATQNKEVPEVDWCEPGEDAGLEVRLACLRLASLRGWELCWGRKETTGPPWES